MTGRHDSLPSNGGRVLKKAQKEISTDFSILACWYYKEHQPSIVEKLHKQAPNLGVNK
jgi:hypothetical protein